MDLWFGDSREFQDVGFKKVTAYKELPDERHDFKLAAAGSVAPGADAVTNNEGLSDGIHYTVVAMLDEKGKQKLDVITDRLSEPDRGEAKLRVINASPIEVDVTSLTAMKGGDTSGTADRAKTPEILGAGIGADRWFHGVNAGSSTSYKQMEPVSGSIQVAPSKGNKHNAAANAHAVTVPVDMAVGKFYTLIVTSGKNGSGLDAVRVEDALTGVPAGSN
jgi:Domain of unknown function (DUF4397)